MRYCHIILVQGCCPLKIKITQFPDGFHLNPIQTPAGDLLFLFACLLYVFFALFSASCDLGGYWGPPLLLNRSQ